MKGGIAAIVPNGSPRVMAMPMRKGVKKGSKEYDVRALRDFLEELMAIDQCKATVERLWGVSLQQWKSSGALVNFGLGYAMGVRWLLESMDITYQLVAPTSWQTQIRTGVGRGTSRDRSIRAVKMLFPDVSLLATERSRKEHDGIADALLLAEFGRRNPYF